MKEGVPGEQGHRRRVHREGCPQWQRVRDGGFPEREGARGTGEQRGPVRGGQRGSGTGGQGDRPFSYVGAGRGAGRRAGVELKC